MIDREDRIVFSEQLQDRQERRRRGRPRTAGIKVRVTVDLPEAAFAELCRRAHCERKSLHALLCDTLITRGQ